MSRYTRRAGKRDSLEPAVIEIARKYGWLVKQDDWVDVIAQKTDNFVFIDDIDGFVVFTRTLLVEVKTGNASLTKGQQKDIEDGWDIRVVRTLEDAERLFK